MISQYILSRQFVYRFCCGIDIVSDCFVVAQDQKFSDEVHALTLTTMTWSLLQVKVYVYYRYSYK